MATIADLRTAKTGFNDVADIFDDVNTRITTYDGVYNSLYTVSTTSEQDVTGSVMTGVVVPTGAKVEVTICGTVSHSIINNPVYLRIRQDSTGAGFWTSVVSFRANTGGGDTPFCINRIFSSSAGTYEYGLKTFLSNTTGYIIIRSITVKVFSQLA